MCRTFISLERGVDSPEDSAQTILMSDLGDSNARKRLRRSKDSTDSMDNIEQFVPTSAAVDDKLFDVYFPKHLESTFAAAIFELGLKHSSPKILMVWIFHLPFLD